MIGAGRPPRPCRCDAVFATAGMQAAACDAAAATCDAAVPARSPSTSHAAGPARRQSTAHAAVAAQSHAEIAEGSRAWNGCRRVAGAVGVACVAVYGSNETGRAEQLGVALQLINIIRDVREDWELGRVYLPQDELSSFGLTEAEIAVGEPTSAWRAFCAFEAARARAYLAEGLTLLDYLDRRSAACVSTFAGLYQATLDRIEAGGYDVFASRPHLSALTKLRIVGEGLRR